ncbi:pentapeptide repeat-containing protein [Cylindrospermum sp. FACHB-282]|uniref:pentapeptide repeat-containing protein n=1 Tax=Cylindrospermum sp. FACHB-282 TaxID=2692794 RepID=UPI001688F61D|nr:pentapeptide repeat-containing protein [Cylindrospermum sp. FACHB-282]MBD2387231.1 pentapeptide repeat-containing protein [Cylindrospermum sp. FACHB-282]
MNKPISQKFTNWIVTAVFMALIVGFSLLEQPSAKAQSITPDISAQSTPAPIKSVAENVRHLLETNECFGCNLIGANLKDRNLQAANLENANLQGADLERANLQGTNLQGANLLGADLGKANIIGANLEKANLFDADLEKANLTDANTIGANFQGADLENAIIPLGFTTP